MAKASAFVLAPGVRGRGKLSWSSGAVRGGSLHPGGAGLRIPGVAEPSARGVTYLLLFSIKVATL